MSVASKGLSAFVASCIGIGVCAPAAAAASTTAS